MFNERNIQEFVIFISRLFSKIPQRSFLPTHLLGIIRFLSFIEIPSFFYCSIIHNAFSFPLSQNLLTPYVFASCPLQLPPSVLLIKFRFQTVQGHDKVSSILKNSSMFFVFGNQKVRTGKTTIKCSRASFIPQKHLCTSF